MREPLSRHKGRIFREIGRELIPPREEPGLGYAETVGGTRYVFADLKTLLARATPPRSGDRLAGLEAADMTERVAAQLALADLPLRRLIEDPVLPYETDEITRLIIDSHDRDAFVPIAAMTVGELRNWLLSDAVDTPALAHIVAGLTPEIAAAVSKIMRLQDLISVAAKCRVVTRFRNTIGLEGRLSTRLQPNHPTDDVRGIAASIVDGLMLGSGDAVIGINPATDSLNKYLELTRFLDQLRERLDLPGQSCVLAHVTTALAAIARGAPVDLLFQSVAGTEAAKPPFRYQSRAAQGGSGRNAVARPRHCRQQRHVFRDRSGQRAVGRGASRRRPADIGSPRLRRGARV
jgi:ethanolamine ammonia-lyase large subunit